MNHLRFLLLTALILIGVTVPVRAQVDGYADLGVCNKGTVPVEVVAATKNLDLLRGFGKYYWRIEGTAVAPGKCKNVYHDTDAGPGLTLHLVLPMRRASGDRAQSPRCPIWALTPCSSANIRF